MLLFIAMKLAKIFTKSSIFITLILVVVLSQIILLRPIIGQGLTNEDYAGLFEARVLHEKISSDPVNTWIMIGPHNATHTYYIYFLDLLFGENYDMYLLSSISIKIIATLLLYPLFLLVTKSKLLAFLVTFIYGISYPSAGALYLYVVGNEYLGVAFMNALLISYYFALKKVRYWLLLLILIFVTFCFLASPIRVFPIFGIIVLVELYLLCKNRLSNLLTSTFRLLAIFLPISVITVSNFSKLTGDTYNLAGLPDFWKLVVDGNWYLLLNPLWGLGYIFLPISQLAIFGKIKISSLFSFLSSLYIATIIFAIIVGFLSKVISQKPIRFFITWLLINFLLNVLLFFVGTHHFQIPSNLVAEFNGQMFNNGLYANILTNFIFSLSITSFLEWYTTRRKKSILFLIFISPFISLVFILSQWIFVRQLYMYQEGIHRYFVIPAIGASLFLASIMVAIYQNSSKRFQPFSLIVIIICLIQIFRISWGEIAQLFNGKKGSGRDLQIQQSLKSQAIGHIPKEKIKDDLIFYVKFASASGAANYWEDTFDWRNLIYWMHIKRSYITNDSIDGCIAMTWDFSELEKMATIQDGSKGFLYKNTGNKEMACFRKAIAYSLDGKFIPLDNLFVFRIENSQVIDISNEVKKGIVFTN